MMTRTETISRLCQLVAEIEEIRTNTEEGYASHELQKMSEKLQDMLQLMQEHDGVLKKAYVTVDIPLNGAVLRRMKYCKEKGLTENDLSNTTALFRMYDDLAAPIYKAWLEQNKEGGKDE